MDESDLILKLLEEFPNSEFICNILEPKHVDILSYDFTSFFKKLIKESYEDNLESVRQKYKIIYELAWEEINKGMFSDVPEAWRKVYGIICIMSVYVNLRMLKSCHDVKLLKENLYLVDLSLIMGGELVLNVNFVANIASQLNHLINIIENKDTIIETPAIAKLDIFNAKFISGLKPIKRIICPSIEEFLIILKSEEPIILENCMKLWPAINKWNVPYLRSQCGYRTVPIEVGSAYSEADWSQKLMTVNDFIDTFFCLDSSERGYLAQHYLFSQVPELEKDIVTPDYCYCDPDSDSVEIDINAWFGPSDTVSPLHQDPKPNFLCQVFGSKYLQLYPVSQTKFLYPNSTTMLKNTSQVDVFSPNLLKFPLFQQACGFNAVLEPGEMVFIPSKCWHYVRSLSASFSVNFWWSKRTDK